MVMMEDSILDLKEKVVLLNNELNKITKEYETYQRTTEKLVMTYSKAYYDEKSKNEQLENIRKEAIEYIENNTKYYDANYSETYRELCSMPGANDTRLHVVIGDTELLNILNKGSEK